MAVFTLFTVLFQTNKGCFFPSTVMGFYGSLCDYVIRIALLATSHDRVLLITSLHVTAIVSFNLLWVLEVQLSAICTLNADPLEVGVPRASVCVLATSICISVRVKECIWADHNTRSNLILPSYHLY